MTPQLGDIVLFTNAPSENVTKTHAAIVIEVGKEEGMVSLFVLGMNNTFFQMNVKHSDDPAVGCWSWRAE